MKLLWNYLCYNVKSKFDIVFVPHLVIVYKNMILNIICFSSYFDVIRLCLEFLEKI